MATTKTERKPVDQGVARRVIDRLTDRATSERTYDWKKNRPIKDIRIYCKNALQKSGLNDKDQELKRELLREAGRRGGNRTAKLRRAGILPYTSPPDETEVVPPKPAPKVAKRETVKQHFFPAFIAQRKL